MSSPHTTGTDVDAAIERDARWAAIVARSRDADGTFYYSVSTTGVYCRPSCGARLPHRKHVRFHRSCADAVREGFRPCKRCKPDQPPLAKRHAATIARVCRAIESAESMPSLADLSAVAGLSPHHLHRVFRSVTGLTPRAYAAAHRAARVRNELTRSTTVTEAIYEAGFNSGGRFYATSDRLLGMTPTDFRAGGTHTVIHFAVGNCSLGSILVAQSAKGVCAILLGDDPDALARDLQDRFPRAMFVGGDADFEKIIGKVVAFVDAPALGLDLPLDVRGTVFQQRVWEALRAIPAGSTVSYSDIAARIGARASVRAVAQACAANTLAVAIPCHRVVKRDGAVSGYRWGVERKRKLIEREAADRSK
jgi:AraC family transcriptional regulator of adaptative response/methylated-DNA-[protein]-cysteine methyltransferase